MYVIKVMPFFTSAHTVLLLAQAIVYRVEQVVLSKKSQGTKDTTSVHVRHPLLHIMQGKRFCLLSCLIPHQCSDCCGFYTMHLQVCFCFFHLCFIPYFEKKLSSSPTEPVCKGSKKIMIKDFFKLQVTSYGVY
jgi:hypothetical protein